MDLLSMLEEYLGFIISRIDRGFIAGSISENPVLFFGIFSGTAICVGIVYLAFKPTGRKRQIRVEPNYGPATLPLHEERVPLSEPDDRGKATFNDVGIYGRMSIAGDID
jgi:hypothetical protein